MREGVFPVRQCPPGAPSAQRQGQAASGAVLANCPRLQSLQGRPEGRARFLLAPGVTGCFVSSHRTVPRGDVISSFPYGSGRHLSKNSSSWPAFHPPRKHLGWDCSPGGSHWLPRWKEAQQLGFQCRWALRRGAGPPSCLCRGCCSPPALGLDCCEVLPSGAQAGTSWGHLELVECAMGGDLPHLKSPLSHPTGRHPCSLCVCEWCLGV